MRVALVGDIAFLGKCSTQGNENVESYFSGIANYLSSFDLVIGNLETPFSLKQKTYGAKSAYIFAHPEDVSLLKMLHFDAVTLANNHIYDYGSEGVELTKKLLDEYEIAYFGIDGKDWRIEKGGNKLAFTGYCCYSTNPLHVVTYGQKGVNEFEYGNVQELLEKNARDGYFSVLAVHAGREHVNYPSVDSIRLAHLLASSAPCIYYGHHPHVAQGIEKMGDSLIAYSLGNFCFDDVYSSVSLKPLVRLSENNRSSFILEVEFENNKIISYKTTPIYIGVDRYCIGIGTTESDIRKYTEAIQTMPQEKYEAMRNKIISDYVAERVSQRDFMWILKRLTQRYVKLFFSNRWNYKEYQRCVKKYL